MSDQSAQPDVSADVGSRTGGRGILGRITLSCVIAWAVLIGGLILPRHGAGIPICPSKAISGAPCPGCGMTRSVSNWMRGDVREAMRYHPFGWAAVLVAAWFAIGPVMRPEFRLRVHRSRVVRTAGIVLLFVFVGYGVVRTGRWIAGDHTIAAGG
jgi:hypothetical protein